MQGVRFCPQNGPYPCLTWDLSTTAGCARRAATEQSPCDSPRQHRHGLRLDQFFTAHSVLLVLSVEDSSFDEEKPYSEKDLRCLSTRLFRVIRHWLFDSGTNRKSRCRAAVLTLRRVSRYIELKCNCNTLISLSSSGMVASGADPEVFEFKGVCNQEVEVSCSFLTFATGVLCHRIAGGFGRVVYAGLFVEEDQGAQ